MYTYDKALQSTWTFFHWIVILLTSPKKYAQIFIFLLLWQNYSNLISGEPLNYFIHIILVNLHDSD
jgi:hypothetical protein